MKNLAFFLTPARAPFLVLPLPPPRVHVEESFAQIESLADVGIASPPGWIEAQKEREWGRCGGRGLLDCCGWGPWGGADQEYWS
jgi:hypothetical protein